MNPIGNTVTAQPALFTSVRWPKASTPKREQILDMINQAVAWSELEEMVRPHYQADIRKTGRKGYSLKMMLRAHTIQQLWLMSDRQLESTLLDSHAMAKFIGTDPWAPRPPSASALRAFRQLLQRFPAPNALDMLDEAVCAKMKSDIGAAGFEYRPGRIEDPVFRSTGG